MPAMSRLLALAVATLLLGTNAEVGDVDDEEALDEVDDPEPLNDGGDEDADAGGESGTENWVQAHQFGSECIQAAEAIESELGTFDDEANDAAKQRQIASSLVEKLQGITGKLYGELEVKLYERMAAITGPFKPDGDNGMGAHDACKFVLNHSDEL